MEQAQLDNSKALDFILAGNATFTLRSKKTGTHYTYKVRAAKDRSNFWFVNLLTGPDNTADYDYIGSIRAKVVKNVEKVFFGATAASRIPASSKCVAALQWVLHHLQKETADFAVEIWHEGRCCRCGRALTVPESIEAGIGPECASKAMGASA